VYQECSFRDLFPAHRLSRYIRTMSFHEIWAEQCQATREIKEHFGLQNALDYLLGEKLLNFADAADTHPEFAAELPRFQAAVWDIFNQYELAGYLTTLKPVTRRKLKRLLYIEGTPGMAHRVGG
jgi:hypothetical protein